MPSKGREQGHSRPSCRGGIHVSRRQGTVMKGLSIAPAMALLLLVALDAAQPAQAQSSDHNALAQRFRPYYKFSTETLFGQERTRPCAWEWFAAHSELRLGSQLYLTNSQLQQDPKRILQQNNSDVR